MPPPPRVIVVGGGTAGIPAALTALELGAEVVLVEKTSRLGGQLWASGAILSGAGSRLQREQGIDDSPSAHEQEVWEAGRRRADREILRLATHEAGPTIDWLEAAGVRFSADSPVRLGPADPHEAYARPRSYVLEAPESLGPYRGPVLAERLIELLDGWRDRPQLSIRLGCAVTELVVEDGRVTGCRLDGDGGEETVAADAVILATGGYGAAPDLLRRFHPDAGRLITQGLAHATGDGILLAERVGGVVVNEDIVIPTLGVVEDPDRPGHRFRDAMVWAGRPPAVSGDIWVNRAGERFVAEDATSPDVLERAILAQPGGELIAIFDEPMRRGLTGEVAQWTTTRLGDPPDPRLVRSAPTIAALAEAASLPVDALTATVREYNAGVALGHDALGRRALPKAIESPPFHAVPTVSAVLVTFAGIRVDAELRVVDGDGRPIAGLFAAGELLGGGQIQGDGFSSGMSATPALAFGRVAARNAVAQCARQGAVIAG